MNRLQLVQRLHTEASATGSSPSTTLSQSGETQRLINWIDSAYQAIQAMHTDWDFLRTEFSVSLTEDDRDYSPSDLSITDFNAWYRTSDDREFTIYSSRSDETFLIYRPWHDFKAEFLFGSKYSLDGRPYFYTIHPDTSIYFDLLPDDTYTFTGEYYKTPDVMDSTGETADTDTHLIPTAYEMVIVWRALMMYAGYENDVSLDSHAQREYDSILSDLERNQLPPQSFLQGGLV